MSLGITQCSVSHDVLKRGLDDRRVIAQVADRDVTARAQNPPRALTTAALPGAAARVIMVNSPARAVRGICPADLAPSLLYREHHVELLQRQPITAQVEHPGIHGILFSSDEIPFSRIFRMTGSAIRMSRAAKIFARFFHPASGARSPIHQSFSGGLPCSRCFPRVFWSAVSRLLPSFAFPCKNVIPDGAYDRDCFHMPSIYRLNTCRSNCDNYSQ